VHWLSHQLATVAALSAEGPDPAVEADRRAHFLLSVSNLVEDLATRPGVSMVFASYEGLLVARAPAGQDTSRFEAVAALSQACLEPASDSAAEIELGNLEQLVLVGDQRKLALIRVGPLTLGMVSPRDVLLAEVTAN
jgi:predicted regulator of Ras-like GTPase activity (Roadblock/LC7/MglB family)